MTRSIQNLNEINIKNISNDACNVVFITDVNYDLATLVACNSLIKNKNESTLINLYIITTGLTEAVKKWFDKFEYKNVNIEIIEVKNDLEDLAQNHQHVSSVALIKFALPNIFKSLNKILYLDSDILILSDITELFSITIKHKYAAVVKDITAMEFGHHVKINHKSYFNTGVMLLNLDKMRKDNIAEKLIKTKASKTFTYFMDQDELNFCFEEKVIFISPKYNLMLREVIKNLEDSANFFDFTLENFEGAVKQPLILHLANSPKIWNLPKASKFQQWLEYLPNNLFLDYVIRLDEFFLNKTNNIVQQAQQQTVEAKAKAEQAQQQTVEAKAKAEQAQQQTVEAKAKAEQAQATLDLHVAQLQAVYNSSSWRITAPLRWPVHQLNLLRTYGFKQRAKAAVKKVLRKVVHWLISRPKLKSLAKQVVNKFFMSERLKLFVRSLLNTPQQTSHQDSSQQISEDSTVLTPRARQIYQDLKQAMQSREKGGV
jgi:lipopolysaccharide biosynthesis glycosyltransferase